MIDGPADASGQVWLTVGSGAATVGVGAGAAPFGAHAEIATNPMRPSDAQFERIAELMERESVMKGLLRHPERSEGSAVDQLQIPRFARADNMNSNRPPLIRGDAIHCDLDYATSIAL